VGQHQVPPEQKVRRGGGRLLRFSVVAHLARGAVNAPERVAQVIAEERRERGPVQAALRHRARLPRKHTRGSIEGRHTRTKTFCVSMLNG
jgi:hypothetical protein